MTRKFASDPLRIYGHIDTVAGLGISDPGGTRDYAGGAVVLGTEKHTYLASVHDSSRIEGIAFAPSDSVRTHRAEEYGRRVRSDDRFLYRTLKGADGP